MEPMILKQDVVEKIKADAILQAKVANALGVSLQTMYRILSKESSPRLTQASVLYVLRDHLKIKKDSELLTDMVAA